MSSFCIYSHFFFSKNTCELGIVLTRTDDSLTTNELVKLTMLRTTGPPGIVMVVPSLLTLVLTVDVYDSHINSRTIDLYLDGKIPKFNFRVDN